MAQQTAISWLMENIPQRFANAFMNECVDVIEQAKQMEREQIIRARQDGLDNGFSNGSWDSNLYYNETYHSNK